MRCAAGADVRLEQMAVLLLGDLTNNGQTGVGE